MLYNEFRFFFNMFFLLIALSQFVPFLKVGFLFTYIAPLVFVLAVTMVKEWYDDFKRWQRDKELNNAAYQVLTSPKQSSDLFQPITSANMKVGMIVRVEQG